MASTTRATSGRSHRARPRPGHRDQPRCLDAAALALCASWEQYAYPGVPGHEPELARAGQQAVTEVMNIIRAAAPDAGSYVTETDYQQPDWQRTVPLVARTAIITAPLVLAMTYPR